MRNGSTAARPCIGYEAVGGAAWTIFYTTSPDERDNAIKNLGYTSDGDPCFVLLNSAPGVKELTPFYRLLQIADPGQRVDLIDAVLASASIPGIFPPGILLDENYVDGGVREILPLQAAIDLGAHNVFGIVGSVAAERADSFTGRSLVDIVSRSVEEIMTDETVRNDSNPQRGPGVSVTVIQHQGGCSRHHDNRPRPHPYQYGIRLHGSRRPSGEQFGSRSREEPC